MNKGNQAMYRPRRYSGRGRGQGRRTEALPRNEALGNSKDDQPVTKVPRPLGYLQLRKIHRISNASDKLCEIMRVKDNLICLLNSDSIREIGILTTVIEILSAVCNTDTMSGNLSVVLNSIRNTLFWKQNLSVFFAEMRTEESRDETDKYPTLLRHLTCLFQEMLDRLDSIDLPLDDLHQTVNCLKAKNIIDDEDIVRTVQKLREARQMKVESMARSSGDSKYDGRPPNDFRQIPIFPTSESLMDEDFDYLRKNKVSEGYLHVEEYLDTQFRLLHQDFLLPLRNAIKHVAGHTDEFRSRRSRQRRIQNAHVYNNINILNTHGSENGIVYTLYMSQKDANRIKWETNRRLLHGSLVCLSADGFHRQLLLGTVHQRDPQRLKKGLLEILFEGETEEGFARSIDNSVTLQMIETSAYFESYRHVLKRLQELNADDMPLKEYFINPSPNVVIKKPSFLDDTGGSATVLDVECLFPKSSDVEVKQIDISNDSQWPRSCEIGCDDSQSEAIKHALRSELALIQGPPGTGKTYVGLRIMETLLKNNHIFASDEEDSSPILVMCYTNHALDQFIEGLLQFLDDNIIRIGGRCKSDRVQRFRLKNVRERIRLNSKVPQNIYGARNQVRHELLKLGNEIEETSTLLYLPSDYILHESTLKGFMDDNHYRSLLTTWLPRGQGSVLLQWLAVGRSGLVQGNTVNTSDLNDLKGRLSIEDGIIDVTGPRHYGHDSDTESVLSTDDNNRYGDIIEAEDEDFMKEALLIDEDETLNIEQNNKPKTHDALSLQGALKNAQPKFALSKIQHNQPNPWQVAGSRRRTPETLQNELYGSGYMKKRDAEQIKDVWEIRNERDKWKLYRYWVKNFTDHYMERKVELEKEYCNLHKRYQEILAQEDRVILQEAKVIAMTTTGASKYHSLLQEIKPKIVMVEEAAEIFEAHIVAAMTNGCKQLILVGDHQQLRPTPTVYKLAKEYNLDVSLFERLIRMKVPFKRLTHQHRMRPEISKYIRHIYQDLQDADVVQDYEDVKGIKSNVFFVDHKVPEEINDKDTTTRINIHEAVFMVELCKYLLRQGYEKRQITILTAYSGQLHVIQQNMPKEDFEGVRIATIDNFQGEENDIILLSLVRSNDDEEVGFLKVENRICVALSRAKKGLYCIGNFDALTLNSDLWTAIIADAKKKRLVDTSLPLVCQCHSNNVTHVSSSTDFDKVPLGGCGRPCESHLECGHRCPRPCHPLDRQHSAVKCKHECAKTVCENGHKCPNRCGEPCVTLCPVKVKKVMPQCKHIQEVECGSDVTNVCCKYPCQIRLPCGHEQFVSCQDKDSVEVQCEQQVTELLDCGHMENRPCYIPKNEFPCPHSCSAILRCGHKCLGNCSKCAEKHQACQERCEKYLSCNHKCEGQCNESCMPCYKYCEQRCIYHNWRCNKPCDRNCVPCKRECKWQCPHSKCSKKCGEICDKMPCNRPCSFRRQNCNHSCIGLCGESCICLCSVRRDQPEIVVNYNRNPNNRFVQLDDCRHVFEVRFLDAYISSMSNTGAKMHLLRHIPCPKQGCDIPIRNCLRYGRVIKKIMLSLNSAKKKMFELFKDVWRTNNNLTHEINEFQQNLQYRHRESVEMEYTYERLFLKQLKESLFTRITPEDTIRIKNQFNIFKFVKELMRAVENRTTFAHSEIADKALETVTERLKSLAGKIQQKNAIPPEMYTVLEECHQIRLLLELEVIDDKLCRRVRETIVSKNSTVSEEQAKLICCQDEDVKTIRSKLKELVWQLENTIASDEQQNNVQDSIDRLLEEHFGSSEVNITGRNVKVEQTSGGISGRWWICSQDHMFPESVLKVTMSDDRLCPACTTL